MRKLTWATFAFTAAIFLAHYVLPAEQVLWWVIVPCVIGLCASVFLRGKVRAGVLLISVFWILGIGRYELHYNNTLERVSPYIGETYRISATVCEYPVYYDDCVKLTVKLKLDEGARVKTVIYDYTGDEYETKPGDVISGEVNFSSAVVSAGEETDTYISKGIYIRGYVTDCLTVTPNNGISIRYLPLQLANHIQNTINRLVPIRTSAFLTALLTGDKTELYAHSELYNTLKRAGIAHVVAVSGMHVSFLLSMILILFGNRIGWIISIVCIVLFAFMTGLSPSVLRAVMMQTLYLLAPVLRRESDGLTSISFALLILLLINPYGISSVGLQLSFLSMLGIVLITPELLTWFEEIQPVEKGLGASLYRFGAASLSTSLGATLFTASVCAYYFGNISLVSPLTNLLVLWIIPFCFGGGFVLFIVSLFSGFLASMIGSIINCAVSFVFVTAEIIGEVPFANVYLPDFATIAWFAVTYLVIGIAVLCKCKGIYKLIIPLSISVTSLMAFNYWNAQSYETGMTVAAIDVEQGQCITVLDEEYTVLFDCGGAYDSGDRAARWLYSHGRERVDLLVISHFDDDHINGVSDLMIQIPVDQIIYCGMNIESDQQAAFTEIKQTAERGGTTMRILNKDSAATIGNMAMRLLVSPGNSSNAGLMVLLQRDDYRMLIMGDANFTGERYMVQTLPAASVDCLIMGHHGSKYSTGDQLLDYFDPQNAIISSGYNTYGHPNEELLDRLEKRNVVIYRTDQLGSIEVKVR